MFIATNWNPIYWNTACLVVNSGSLEEEDDFEEDENGDIIPKKEKATDYSKVAKALGDILARGIKISLVDINKSNYSFEPDIESNEILFGMKALGGVGGPIIEQIIANRPYDGIADFMVKCPLNKTAMISLIKAGAFDKLEKELGNEMGVHPRIAIMAYYLSKTCDAKKRITLQNLNGMIQHNLLPEQFNFQKRVFLFTKYLKANKKVGKYYVFDEPCMNFYEQFFDMEQLDVINGVTCILQTKWDKIYQNEMDTIRDYIKTYQQEILEKFNTLLFQEAWEKYAQGSISAWEMESLCFYYNEHELAHVDNFKYGLVDFFTLPTEPRVDYFFKRNNKEIPIYKTYKIVGTVISKNDARSSITILTTSGIVTVKFTKEYFAMFNRQLSERQEDGTRKVIEKGWFVRGTKVMLTGFRRDDMFVAKTYAKTSTHQLYKIAAVADNGELELVHERKGLNDEYDNNN